jgi:hypothetical protein
MPHALNTPYINTIPRTQQPRYPGNRELERRIKSIIRWNAMAMVTGPTSTSTAGGAHLDVRQLGDAVRSRRTTTSSAAAAKTATAATWSISRGTPRPACTPGVPGRPAERRESRNFRRELQPTRRPVELSAPLADARFLGVPHGLDGPRADHGDLPGAVQRIPEGPRHQRHQRPQGLGVPGRRRMRRAGIARRDHAGRPRASRQSDLRDQLQPAAARRPGPRQRQDHPGARRAVPRRRLERDQGGLGRRLGSASGKGRRRASWPSGWKKSSTASTRSTR